MSDPSHSFDVIILGGGAAGLMCALEAGRCGRRALLLEHNDKVGKKIRISGGGRCNFTNINAMPDRYLSRNPRFAYSALARYTPQDFIGWVEGHGIAWHEKKLGQLFCDESAQQIIDALVADCAAVGVEIRTGCTVQRVEKPEAFRVTTTSGVFTAAALVVATGGLSIPKLGATGFGYDLARQFDVPLVDCAPGLVPMTLDASEMQSLEPLSGISFDATVSIGKRAFDEAVLITHRGLSGPAILQISSYWNTGDALAVDVLPGLRVEEKLFQRKARKPQSFPRAFLGQHLSGRLAQRLCNANGWFKPFGEMADADLRTMAATLQQWRIPVTGTEGYPKAEVTRGGVDTKALSPKTMEVKAVPGLYFIGEVVDMTGWLGGYNFQWAWSSAVAAGQAV
jgi:hypothetical protein